MTKRPCTGKYKKIWYGIILMDVKGAVSQSLCVGIGEGDSTFDYEININQSLRNIVPLIRKITLL